MWFRELRYFPKRMDIKEHTHKAALTRDSVHKQLRLQTHTVSQVASGA